MIGPLSSIAGLSTLWGLLAVVGALTVVALHMRSWRRARLTVHPGALVMATGTQRAQAPARRALSRWLLVLVRALALGLALLAFDRPVWTGEGGIAGRGGTEGGRRVIVIDVSASMGMPASNTTRLGLAQQRARELIGRETPTAIVYAGASARDATVGFTTDRATLLGEIDRAEAMREAGAPELGIARARALLGGDGGRIDVITDGQHTITRDAAVSVHTVSTQTRTPNASVVGLTWEPARPVAGDRVRLTCSLVRTGEVDGGSRVTFAIGGRTVEAWAPPGAESSASASIVVEEGSATEVSARVEPDAFAMDDAARALIDIPRALDVRTIGDTHPLDLALAVPEGAARYRVIELDTTSDAIASDAILCAGDAGIAIAMIDALAEAHRSGTPVVWVVRTRSAADAFAYWAQEIGIDAPSLVAGSSSNVTLRPSEDRTALGATTDFIARSDIEARASFGVGADPNGWRTAMRDDENRPRVLLRENAALVLFDLASVSFARSPVAVMFARELFDGLVGTESAIVADTYPRIEAEMPKDRVAGASVDSGGGVVAGERSIELAPWMALAVLVLLACEPLVQFVWRDRGGRR